MIAATCVLDEAAINVLSQVIGGSGEIENLEAKNIKAGVTILNVEGNFTADANATADKILNGYTAYVNGQKVTGEYEA